MSPQEAIERLLEGNRRFRSGASTAWEYWESDLRELAKVQTPIAAVVACSDSRVSPEIVFDQPLGTIFACRVPGNVAAESSKWVVDMAVSEFKVPLVLVMGHSGCLAVTSVVKGTASSMAGLLKLEVKAGLSSVRQSEIQDRPILAVEANAKYAAGHLSQTVGSLKSAIETGQTRCQPAVYDMETGEVRLL